MTNSVNEQLPLDIIFSKYDYVTDNNNRIRSHETVHNNIDQRIIRDISDKLKTSFKESIGDKTVFIEDNKYGKTNWVNYLIFYIVAKNNDDFNIKYRSYLYTIFTLLMDESTRLNNQFKDHSPNLSKRMCSVKTPTSFTISKMVENRETNVEIYGTQWGYYNISYYNAIKKGHKSHIIGFDTLKIRYSYKLCNAINDIDDTVRYINLFEIRIPLFDDSTRITFQNTLELDQDIAQPSF